MYSKPMSAIQCLQELEIHLLAMYLSTYWSLLSSFNHLSNCLAILDCILRGNCHFRGNKELYIIYAQSGYANMSVVFIDWTIMP